MVENMDKKLKEIEGKISDYGSKSTSNAKQLNTTTQKAEDAKVKLSNLESRVAKFEKK